MNLPTLIVAGVVAIIFVFTVISLIRSHRSHRSCGRYCGCEGCALQPRCVPRKGDKSRKDY